MADEPTGPDDIAIECRFYDDLADLLGALSGNYRVLASVLRGLDPAGRDLLRDKVLKITRSTFDSARITVALLERKPVGETP